MNSDFIIDENFRLILKRDFEELAVCLDLQYSTSIDLLIIFGKILSKLS